MAFFTPAGLLDRNSASLHASKPSIGILAGNSRLDVNADGTIKVEAQMAAFRAGLIYADEIRRMRGDLPPISIAFDHKGVFRRQFLSEGLSNSQKRNPRLCHLRAEIIEIFGPLASELSIPLDHIHAIHEDSARTHAEHVLSTASLSAQVRHRMVANVAEHSSGPSACSSRITCAAITSEYFCKAVRVDSPISEQSVLEVFFEVSPWSEVLAYVRGLQLTHALGMKFGVRLNLVTPDGMVQRGEIVHAQARDLPELIAQVPA